MAAIKYKGKRIIPCPFISLTKEYTKAAGGSILVDGSDSYNDVPGVADDETALRKKNDHIIGVTHSITVRGTCTVSMQGSPSIDIPDDALSTFHTHDSNYPGGGILSPAIEAGIPHDRAGFRALIHIQEALRALFAEDGELFEIYDQDNHLVMSCVTRFKSITFEEAEAGENWTNRCNYSIELETDRIYGEGFGSGEDAENGGFDNLPKDVNGNEIFLRDASENWSIEPQEEGSKGRDYPSDSSNDGSDISSNRDKQYLSGNDNPYTFRVTHTITATGKRVYGMGDDLYDSDPYLKPLGGDVTSEAWEEAKKWVTTKLGLTFNKKVELLQGLGISGPNSIMLDNDAGHSLESGQTRIVSGHDGDGDPYDETTACPRRVQYQEYNRTRTENIDEYAGTYGVTENWILSRDPYIEDFNISMRTSNTQGTVLISMDGNIRGLDDGSDVGSLGLSPDSSDPDCLVPTGDPRVGYQGETDPIYANSSDGEGTDAKTIYNKVVNRKEVNALERFNSIGFYQRASMYLDYFLKKNGPRADNSSSNPFAEYSWGGTVEKADGYDGAEGLCISPSRLNPLPVSKSASLNPVAGTISYQVEYDNTPRTSVYALMRQNDAYDSADSDCKAPCRNEFNINTETDPYDPMHPTQTDSGGFSGSLTSLEEDRFDVSDITDPYSNDCCPYEDNSPTVSDSSQKLYARTENINVQWTGGHQKYAMIPVLGRNYPIAQNLGNREIERINITIEAVMDIPDSPFWSSQNKPTNIETEVIPIILRECGALEQRLPLTASTSSFGGTPFGQISRAGFDHPGPDDDGDSYSAEAPTMQDYFIESDQESWTPRTGRYNRNITFVYKQCLAATTDVYDSY